MEFRQELQKGIFIKRYKRFFTDLELNGQPVVAHLPNTGSLKSCYKEGNPCLVSPADNPERKLKYTLEAIQMDQEWVGVNTSWPNKLAVEVFKNGLLDHWRSYDRFQQEVKINDHSRMDLILWNSEDSNINKWSLADFKKNQKVHFVEVKNVTLKEGRAAQFPDAVTERGQKHIQELRDLMKLGFTAEMLFVVQRTDIDFFETAKEIDSEYSRLLKLAADEGLKVTALSFKISPTEIRFAKVLPWSF